MTTMPLSSQATMRSENRRLGDFLVADDVPDGDPGRKLRAVARHLVDYRTWRSLAIQQELSDAEAVEIGVRLLTVLATTKKAGRRSGVPGLIRRTVAAAAVFCSVSRSTSGPGSSGCPVARSRP